MKTIPSMPSDYLKRKRKSSQDFLKSNLHSLITWNICKKNMIKILKQKRKRVINEAHHITCEFWCGVRFGAHNLTLQSILYDQEYSFPSRCSKFSYQPGQGRKITMKFIYLFSMILNITCRFTIYLIFPCGMPMWLRN